VSDAVLRAHSQDGRFRVVAAQAGATFAEGSRRHGLAGVSALAFGRALLATALVGSVEKGGGRFTVQWAGRGPLGNVHIDLRAGGALRGYVSGHPPDGALSIEAALGPGLLVVVRHPAGAPMSQGQAPLDRHDVDRDMESWLQRSDQVPSVLRTSLDTGAAAGILIQTLPGGDPALLAPEGGRLDPALFHRAFPADLAPLALVSKLTRDFGWEVVDEGPLTFRCTCSRARVLSGVELLGWEEIAAMLDAGETTSVRCEFCSTEWTVGHDDLVEVLGRLASGQA
jgi:molecular chaperone Hsp33